MSALDKNYWEKRWDSQKTGWDIGYASPPLLRYTKNLAKDTRILIPGAGSAYEAIHLHQQGFTQVYVCDWAADAFNQLKEKCPDFPKDHIIVANYFELDLAVDLQLEQTFFCALAPSKRADYVKKASELIVEGGKLAGLLFGVEFSFDGPPFGGLKSEYTPLFETYFNILQMDIAPDSIPPRQGNELFIEMQKK